MFTVTDALGNELKKTTRHRRAVAWAKKWAVENDKGIFKIIALGGACETFLRETEGWTIEAPEAAPEDAPSAMPEVAPEPEPESDPEPPPEAAPSADLKQQRRLDPDAVIRATFTSMDDIKRREGSHGWYAMKVLHDGDPRGMTLRAWRGRFQEANPRGDKGPANRHIYWAIERGAVEVVG